MSDPGTRAADRAHAEAVREINRIFRQAQEEITEKLDEHVRKYALKDAAKRAQVAAGTLTEEKYQDWISGQVFIGKQWKDKITSVAASLHHANVEATAMIEGKKKAVFGENATFQSYQLEHDAGMDLSFTVYDQATVTRLIREKPELLPRKVVDGKKDVAWCQKQIAGALTQGIIQGESIQQIAERIAADTGSQCSKAMVRYARTAMTGSQNAGRMEALHHAQEMGIVVKKRWLATLDSRTRDAHANLDGQVQNVDDPFESDLGEIMFPGDWSAHPGNFWCCRCTLTYVYPEYPEQYGSRRAYAEYIDDDGNYHRESYEMANVTYNVWKLIKGRDAQQALEAWRQKTTLQEVREQQGRQPLSASIASTQPPAASDAEKIAGVSKGPEMDFDKANHLKGNPHFGESSDYGKNCQSCVPVYEMRRRGYDVEAKPREHEGAMEELAKNPLMIWSDPVTGKTPKDVFNAEYGLGWNQWGTMPGKDKPSSTRFIKRASGIIEEGQRWQLQFPWKGGGAHTVTMYADPEHGLTLYDPQCGGQWRGDRLKDYMDCIKYSFIRGGKKYYRWPTLARIDDKKVDFDIASKIMKKAGD